MENCLSKNPDINVVYTINEPAANGANKALEAAAKTGVRSSPSTVAAPASGSSRAASSAPPRSSTR